MFGLCVTERFETSGVFTCSGRIPTGMTRLRIRHGSVVRSRSRRSHGSSVGPGKVLRQLFSLDGAKKPIGRLPGDKNGLDELCGRS